MNTLNFLFNETELQVYGTVEEPIFAINEICDLIGIKKDSDLIRRVKKDENFRPVIQTHPQIPQKRGKYLAIVNEEGLYEILFRSDSQIASQFRLQISKWLKQQRISQSILKQEKIQELEVLMKQLEEKKLWVSEQLQKEKTARNTDKMSRDYNHRIVKFVNRKNEDELLYVIYFDEKFRNQKVNQAINGLLNAGYHLNDINQIDDYNHYRKVDAREEVMEMNKLYKIQVISKMTKI